MVLSAVVVPCTINAVRARSVSALRPSASASRASPPRTPSDWSAGVVGCLASRMRSPAASTRSVKVPPTSMPMRYFIRAGRYTECSGSDKATRLCRVAHVGMLHRGRSMPPCATRHKRVALSLPLHSVYRPTRMKYRIGIDVGGTFTDLVLAAGDRIRLAKHPTTPADQSDGVLGGLARLA